MATQTVGLTSKAMARMVADDLTEGAVVNLGIGMPQAVAAEVPPEREVIFHAENGVLGIAGDARLGEEDPDLIDAGKRPIRLVAGASFMHHTDSFAIIRGGHIDVCVMGAHQVSTSGDLANWWDGEGIPAVGGAMDLAVGAKQVWVLMRHQTREGGSKLVNACTLPLTARSAVTRIYTDLGVFLPAGDHFEMVRIAPGVDLAAVRGASAAPIEDPT